MKQGSRFSGDAEKDRFTARDAVIDQMRELLIGPLDLNEVLDTPNAGTGPSDYYLTGILWPRNARISPEEDESKTVEAEKGAEAGDPDDGAPIYSVFRPSSIGVTCTIEGSNQEFVVAISGARYVREEIQMEHGATASSGEKPKSAEERFKSASRYRWQRVPFEYFVEVAGNETRPVWKTNKFKSKDGADIDDSGMSVHIKRRVSKDLLIVTASFINESCSEARKDDKLSLFQTSIAIKAADPGGGAGRIMARRNERITSDDDGRMNELLYRDYSEFAVGHGVATGWEKPVKARVTAVYTDWMPVQKVPQVSPDGHASLNTLRLANSKIFSASFLSKASNRLDIVRGLESFCAIYSEWIGMERKRIASIPAGLQKDAGTNLDSCDRAFRRMMDGISLMQKNDNVLLAFCLANEVMAVQSTAASKGAAARQLVWRPFQLAFILLTIPSLVDPKSADRSVLDLLWFPTGGGKTEAYLGIVAFAIFYRRLTAKLGDAGGHVDVLMRYTLRLLTIQQFQRAAAMICAAELIRKKDPKRLGTVAISLGLYVGGGATPNKLADAREALAKARSGDKPMSTPAIILDCPLCGTAMTAADYSVNADNTAMQIRCKNKVTCPSKGDPLPVHTVDEEIYKIRPSLLIGTIDKFAQLPRNEDAGLLFRKPDGFPPELIIQDELHLITGPLGTIAAVYETCIDALSSVDGNKPKIIGSTATIGRAGQQVHALFDRDVFQFPPAGLDADNSFFAVRDTKRPDRAFIGLSSAGRSPKFTLQAAAAGLLVCGSSLESILKAPDAVVDPYWTGLFYFNSLRELGGADVMMYDDVPRSIKFFSNRLNCPERKLDNEVIEMTSNVSSSDIPQILKRLEVGKGGDIYQGSPADVVLASNMISVGVDIPRLGLMLVNGQPKSTSEYIQASSRIGRGIPGLILTVYNCSRPRDISHFEHFANYHQALYRRVEAISVTPWSSRARDKALHALFVSMVRYLSGGMSQAKSAIKFDPSDPAVKNIVAFILARVRSSGQTGSKNLEMQTRTDLKNIEEHWKARAEQSSAAGQYLEYWARLNPQNKPVNPTLMRSAEEVFDDPNVWRTPNSMREVEPSVYFTLWND